MNVIASQQCTGANNDNFPLPRHNSWSISITLFFAIFFAITLNTPLRHAFAISPCHLLIVAVCQPLLHYFITPSLFSLITLRHYASHTPHWFSHHCHHTGTGV